MEIGFREADEEELEEAIDCASRAQPARKALSFTFSSISQTKKGASSCVCSHVNERITGENLFRSR